MNDYNTEKTIVNMANFILQHKTTIRATSKEFNIPKSTVHNYFNTKLKHIDLQLYKEVKNLLKENFNNKHIHGGESTKNKYLKLKILNNKNDEIEAIF